MNKRRIVIEQSPGYRGYFWKVQEYFSKYNLPDDWHTVSRGGYAITKLGAEWAGKRQIAKMDEFKTKDREWVVEVL
jgi:predicted transcriptional regulator